MGKGCPFTKSRMYKEITKGTLVEVNPEKDDNIFELDEALAFYIEIHNTKTHSKRPLKGVPVTLRMVGSTKSKTLITGSDGYVHFTIPRIGTHLLAYYDEYEKTNVVSTFKVVLHTTVVVEPDPDEPQPVSTLKKKEAIHNKLWALMQSWWKS